MMERVLAEIILENNVKIIRKELDEFGNGFDLGAQQRVNDMNNLPMCLRWF